MQATLVYPHQLFSASPAINSKRLIILIEHALFFGQLAFHKKKLLLQRASMQVYNNKLNEAGFRTLYLDYSTTKSNPLYLQQELTRHNIKEVHICKVIDDWLEREINSLKPDFVLRWYDSPNFLLSEQDCIDNFSNSKKLKLHSFYIAQRKRLNLLTTNAQPLGGKWSLDAENRKKLPKNIAIPPLCQAPPTAELAEAQRYVLEHFPKNPGSITNFEYPLDTSSAYRFLQDFLEHKLNYYGDYQDAIDSQQSFLFHSVLSSSLNIGLINPSDIIAETQSYCAQHHVPLNCLEGFIRQIIGWREYVRGVYHCHGRFQRTRNFFGHTRALPKSFWNAQTGMLPIDNVISKVLQTGYANHIERLMILSNFFLLCEIHPNAVHDWFSELFIDAFDWVMVPNVYGMGLYADGGLMITKPYISSSNYLRKMSNFPKGTWCETWDALYWRFMHLHRDLFNNNPRTRMTLSHLDRMPKDKLDQLLLRAEEFLTTLERSDYIQ